MLQLIELKFELTLSLVFIDFTKHAPEHGHIKNGYKSKPLPRPEKRNIIER
jgi:hypothetical protein